MTLSERRSPGLTGSTTNDDSRPSQTFRQLSMNQCIIKTLSYEKHRDSDKTVSDESCANQFYINLYLGEMALSYYW